MAVTIRAYRWLSEALDQRIENGRPVYDRGLLFSELVWTPGRLAPLDASKVYLAEERETVYDGSCSSWCEWRIGLARLVDYPITQRQPTPYSSGNEWIDYEHLLNDKSRQSRPFYDLIYHSDSEGSIGPDACKRLRLAFEDWRHAATSCAQPYGGIGTWFEQYNRLHRALETEDTCVLDFT